MCWLEFLWMLNVGHYTLLLFTSAVSYATLLWDPVITLGDILTQHCALVLRHHRLTYFFDRYAVTCRTNGACTTYGRSSCRRRNSMKHHCGENALVARSSARYWAILYVGHAAFKRHGVSCKPPRSRRATSIWRYMSVRIQFYANSMPSLPPSLSFSLSLSLSLSMSPCIIP